MSRVAFWGGAASRSALGGVARRDRPIAPTRSDEAMSRHARRSLKAELNKADPYHRRRVAGWVAAQAVFDTPDLRRLIFEFRARALLESMVKWSGLARKELPKAEKREASALRVLALRLRHADRALSAARGSVARTALFRPRAGPLGAPSETPEATIRGVEEVLKQELARRRAYVQALQNARNCLHSAWPRRVPVDDNGVRRKLSLCSLLAIRELRRSVDAVLRGTMLHPEFVAAVGRPSMRAPSNPVGTARSQTDLRRFLTA